MGRHATKPTAQAENPDKSTELKFPFGQNRKSIDGDGPEQKIDLRNPQIQWISRKPVVDYSSAWIGKPLETGWLS